MPTLLAVLAWAMLVVSLPASVWAADPGSAPPSEGTLAPVITFAPVLYVITFVVFLSVMFFLKKSAWGPFLATLDARETKIRESAEAAANIASEADAAGREHEAVLAQARSEATGIVEEGKRKAEAIAARLRDEARAEADALKDRALGEIAAARRAAVAEIQDRAVDLALEISQKLVNKSLQADDHRSTIDEVIRRHDAKAGMSS